MSLRTALRLPLRAQPRHLTVLRSPVAGRPFITFPGSDTQDLHATRLLPYACDPLYELIADVDSYSQFVPYCAVSRVTQWSTADADGRRWPTLADLHVGWGGFNETFTSRLHCEPGVFVEAVSGDGQSGAPASIFKSLVTRWSLRPVAHQPSPSTEVRLTIKYQFVNPLYAAVSAAVSDKVAGVMVEAFEQRAREQLSDRRRQI